MRGVTLGSGKKGFGSSALPVNTKIFAMLSFERKFVVKLPKKRVNELVASGSGERFDPGHGPDYEGMDRPRTQLERRLVDPGQGGDEECGKPDMISRDRRPGAIDERQSG
jgi:hypothetical protein